MIYIASDKHGYEVIKVVQKYLSDNNISFVNVGVNNIEEDISLEEIIPKVVKNVLNENNSTGILSCGTGVGVEIGANKFAGIRSILATNEKTAEWARVYDNCNILCLSGWDFKEEEIVKILEKWFNSNFDGSEKRLKMFETFNTWH